MWTCLLFYELYLFLLVNKYFETLFHNVSFDLGLRTLDSGLSINFIGMTNKHNIHSKRNSFTQSVKLKFNEVRQQNI